MTLRQKASSRTLYKARPAGTLKAAMAALVEANGGTVKSADLLGVSQGQVQRCTDPAEPKYELKVSQVRLLERAGGNPVVTGYLAAEARCGLIPLDIMTQAPLSADMAQFGETASRMFGRYAMALTDGELSASEAGALKRDALAVMAAVAAMLPDLDAVMGDEK